LEEAEGEYESRSRYKMAYAISLEPTATQTIKTLRVRAPSPNQVYPAFSAGRQGGSSEIG